MLSITSMRLDGYCVYVRVACHHCGEEWKDLYDFSGRVITKLGKEID